MSNPQPKDIIYFSVSGPEFKNLSTSNLKMLYLAQYPLWMMISFLGPGNTNSEAKASSKYPFYTADNLAYKAYPLVSYSICSGGTKLGCILKFI